MDRIKKYEKKYMYRICESQIGHLKLISKCCLVYGLVGYFLISRVAFLNPAKGRFVYAIFLGITAFIVAYQIIGNKFIKKENETARYHFCNIGILLMTQIYLIWSFFAVDVLYQDINHLNMLPWFTVYIVCVTSFFYRFRDFCIISFVNIAYSIYNNRSYQDSDARFVLPYVFTFIIISVMIYVFKHYRELELFEKQLDFEKNVEVKKLLTASMNHELRTPLNSIIGNAQIMLSDNSLNENEREITETIFNTSKVMVQLVNDLLDYSKIDAGEFIIVNNEFNLTVLKDNIYSMMLQLAREKGLDYDVSIEEGTPLQLVGDIRRIQQIAINIISNGIKYTSVGSVKSNFSMKNGKLRMVTIDTGMGMSKDALDDLFVPYKRLNEEKTKSIQGTGLGMFVVKQLLDQMGGTIKVSSVLDLGSNIIIEIPVTTVKNSEIYHKKAQTYTDSQSNEKKTYDFTGKVILTVDDTVINNKIVQNILESVGATTYCSLDGENCLRFISKHNVDLILLDHFMPGMDGVECLKRIRSSSKDYKDVPVIMLSGNTDEDSVRKFNEAKANGVLSKPIMVDQLFEMIDKVLN